MAQRWPLYMNKGTGMGYPGTRYTSLRKSKKRIKYPEHPQCMASICENVEWKVMEKRRGLKVPEGERFRRSRLATGTAWCWGPGLDWTAMADVRFTHEWIMFPLNTGMWCDYVKICQARVNHRQIYRKWFVLTIKIHQNTDYCSYQHCMMLCIIPFYD